MTHTLICEIFSKCLLYESWDQRNSLEICGWHRQYKSEAFQRWAFAKLNRFQNLKSATHPQSLITSTLFLQNHWSCFVRSISGEEDLFHRINAEDFSLRQSCLSIKSCPQTSDLASSASVALPSGTCVQPWCVCVCVCVYHAARRWHNWCTLCVVYEPGPFFFFYEPCYCHWYNVSPEPGCTRHMHRGLVEDDWYETPAMRRLRWRKATRMRSKRSEVLFFFFSHNIGLISFPHISASETSDVFFCLRNWIVITLQNV